MRFHEVITKFSPLAIAALIGFSACSDMGTEPLESSHAHLAWQNQTAQDETPALLDGIDIDGAYEQELLVDGAARPTGGAPKKLLAFAESNDDPLDKQTRRWIVKAEWISPTGGEIWFGNDKIGYSVLEFPAGAVDEDVLITLVHKIRGARDIFLFPEGIVFDEPVTLKFNLVGLKNRQKKRLLELQLFYHNPDPDGDPRTDDGGWELVPSYSDGEWVIATLEHFSRYAVGSDR
jgi:hypothetical protein